MKKLQAGFTFTEVTIAGVILAVGMVMLLQLTRQVLDSINPNDPLVVQNSPVIEQFMQAQVESIKAYRANPVPPVAQIASVSYGLGSLYATITTSSAGLPPASTGTIAGGVNAAITYRLWEYDIVVKMSMAAHYVQSPGDPVLGHTVFWKLGNNGSFKSAL